MTSERPDYIEDKYLDKLVKQEMDIEGPDYIEDKPVKQEMDIEGAYYFESPCRNFI